MSHSSVVTTSSCSKNSLFRFKWLNLIKLPWWLHFYWVWPPLSVSLVFCYHWTILLTCSRRIIYSLNCKWTVFSLNAVSYCINCIHFLNMYWLFFQRPKHNVFSIWKICDFKCLHHGSMNTDSMVPEWVLSAGLFFLLLDCTHLKASHWNSVKIPSGCDSLWNFFQIPLQCVWIKMLYTRTLSNLTK